MIAKVGCLVSVAVCLAMSNAQAAGLGEAAVAFSSPQPMNPQPMSQLSSLRALPSVPQDLQSAQAGANLLQGSGANPFQKSAVSHALAGASLKSGSPTSEAFTAPGVQTLHHTLTGIKTEALRASPGVGAAFAKSAGLVEGDGLEAIAGSAKTGEATSPALKAFSLNPQATTSLLPRYSN